MPPPVAPPLSPKTGPKEGSRTHASAFSPAAHKASARPIVVVVLPSPAGVGLTAVTKISLEERFLRLIFDLSTLAM